jgi:hypothetical protein
MKVVEFAEKLGLKALTGNCGLEKEITSIYTCDLLSWAMAHASKGDAWITVHTHLNVVAVALLVETACVIIPEGIAVDAATVAKAMEEKIAILSSDKSAYEICWKGHELISTSL